MLKQLAELEHKIGERVYQFVCDPNSPLSECKAALQAFDAYVNTMLEQWEAAKQAAEASSKESEQPKEEVANG